MSSGVSVIIPAYNEGSRIGRVIDVAKSVPHLSEILVVDDGSNDKTPYEARRRGARVLSLKANRGKGSAMSAGIGYSRGRTIIFLDADLIGLRPDHLRALSGPVNDGEAAAVIGRIYWPGPMAAHVSGQRAVTREVAIRSLSLGLSTSGYRADSLLYRAAVQCGGPIYTVDLPGVSHPQKAEKWNKEGIIRTLAMPLEVIGITRRPKDR